MYIINVTELPHVYCVVKQKVNKKIKKTFIIMSNVFSSEPHQPFKVTKPHPYLSSQTDWQVLKRMN